MRDAYGLIKPMPGSTKPASDIQDRQTYIPPHVESAMAEHVQQSMPAHLQKYKGSNTYIPEHAQAEMTQHLEDSLPQHMKQYAGAYMQQNVVEPSLDRRSTPRTPVDPIPAPTSSAPTVSPIPQNPAQAGAVTQPSTTVAPAYPAQSPAPNQDPDQPYDFITNAAQPPKEPFLNKVPGGNSLVGRIGLAVGGLVVLLVVFLIFKGLLSGPTNVDSFVTIAQQQQELIHLATNASQQPGTSVSNKNLAATMQASLTSSQAATTQYLATNGKKINQKQLDLKVSAATDKQLTDAATAGSYNETFKDVIKNKLATYGATLDQTYRSGPGPKGKTLLEDSYRQVQLFQTQLETPVN